MKNKCDLLLVNSLAPRQRIASDAALENSLAILRTYLENSGLLVEVVDDQRVAAMEIGVPKWCLRTLRLMIGLQTKAYQKRQKLGWSILVLATWPIQALALHYRMEYINRRIDDIICRLKESNISFLGIKVWYGDSFTWSKRLATKVRAACPETIIVAGGPQVKVYGEEILPGTEFDVAIMGPGEEVLERMILLRRNVRDREEFLNAFHREISSSKFVKTGIYKENCTSSSEGQNKSITIPHYRQVDLQGKILFHTIVDGFGCSWNKCNFCSHTRQANNYQPRSAKEISEEIRLMSQQGISFFRFSSSETPIYHGKDIAQEVIAEDLNINFSMFARAVKVTPETYEAYCLMIKAGLRAIFMGGETGHDVINENVMNKGIRKKDIVDTIHCIRLAAAAVGKNCRIGLSLIYPCPVTKGVTLQQVFDENIRLIQETMPDTVIVNPPGVFPKTKWMEQAKDFGFDLEPDFVAKLMEYEYSIYKPVEFWARLGCSLQGLAMPDLLKETGRLRNAIMDMGIPTDISDEYLMMTEAIGYNTRIELMKFKSNSLQDILSGSNRYMQGVVDKINAESRRMALNNKLPI